MQKKHAFILTAFVVVLIAAFFASPVLARRDDNPQIDICHWAGNPGGTVGQYNPMTVDDDGAANGHSGHSWDVIPAPAGGCPDTPPNAGDDDDADDDAGDDDVDDDDNDNVGDDDADDDTPRVTPTAPQPNSAPTCQTVWLRHPNGIETGHVDTNVENSPLYIYESPSGHPDEYNDEYIVATLYPSIGTRRYEIPSQYWSDEYWFKVVSITDGCPSRYHGTQELGMTD